MRLLPFVLASTLIAFAPAVRADEADDLILQGIELREHGKDDEALVLFERALAKTPSPRAQAQVGLAQQALGLWVAAERSLALALAVTEDPWVSKNRAALEGALATTRKHVGGLDVRGNQGASVLLDGATLGTLPHAPSA